MRTAFATLALAALSSVNAAPLQKRIQQVIADSLTKWEQACLAAGGGQQCNPLKVSAFSTLLAAPGPCEQQNQSDAMIDLAHQLNNDSEMIRLTQIFRQQPRNAPDSLSVLYCQQAPRNQELSGLFQCQFQGVNDNVFTGQVALGQPGTIPFGLSSLSPLGSCPANPGGKIPDGEQLVDLVSDPGTPSSGGNDQSGNNNNNNNDNSTPVDSSPAADPSTDAREDPTTAAAPAVTTPATTSSSGFQTTNAQTAQQLNVQFESLTEGSSCTVGQVACAGGKFAQCPFGTFVTTECSGGTQCFALPLVNSVGTSVTCTTSDDAARRFEAAGVTGGFDGNH